MKTKKNSKLEFYDQKWFKLICLLVFFGWLFSMIDTTFQIKSEELIELNVTVKGECKFGSPRNPIKLSFKTKEFSNSFGIYTGGTYGRWTEVTDCLKENSMLKIKIHKNNKKKLNKDSKTIPIYYLSSNDSGLIFNENEFNQGEKDSDNRVLIFFIVVFIIAFWKIVSD